MKTDIVENSRDSGSTRTVDRQRNFPKYFFLIPRRSLVSAEMTDRERSEQGLVCCWQVEMRCNMG